MGSADTRHFLSLETATAGRERRRPRPAGRGSGGGLSSGRKAATTAAAAKLAAPGGASSCRHGADGGVDWRRQRERRVLAAAISGMAPARRRVPAVCSCSTLLIPLSAAVGKAGPCHIYSLTAATSRHRISLPHGRPRGSGRRGHTSSGKTAAAATTVGTAAASGERSGSRSGWRARHRRQAAAAVAAISWWRRDAPRPFPSPPPLHTPQRLPPLLVGDAAVHQLLLMTATGWARNGGE